jgi:hypothetical protein
MWKRVHHEKESESRHRLFAGGQGHWQSDQEDRYVSLWSEKEREIVSKPKVGSENTTMRDANLNSAPGSILKVAAGGEPSTSTPKDKRLKENKK